jgi:6-phosphofructokinase
MAGAANRCVIPEHKFNIERLTELLVQDRFTNPSHYSVALVSEGARFEEGAMIFEKEETDQYGHRKLGGIGDRVSAQIHEISARFNKGRKINVINQRLGYLVRCGNPDAIDSIAPMAFGNLALNLILNHSYGRLVNLRNGRYDDVPLDVITSVKKVVAIEKYYNCDRLRPYYESFESKPLFIMTSDY